MGGIRPRTTRNKRTGGNRSEHKERSEGDLNRRERRGLGGGKIFNTAGGAEVLAVFNVLRDTVPRSAKGGSAALPVKIFSAVISSGAIGSDFEPAFRKILMGN